MPKRKFGNSGNVEDSICISCREFDVCPIMYASGYNIHSWVLGRYLSNIGMGHWKTAKIVMRYLKKTKYYMLTYKRSDQLEITGYSVEPKVIMICLNKSLSLILISLTLF